MINDDSKTYWIISGNRWANQIKRKKNTNRNIFCVNGQGPYIFFRLHIRIFHMHCVNRKWQTDCTLAHGKQSAKRSWLKCFRAAAHLCILLLLLVVNQSVGVLILTRTYVLRWKKQPKPGIRNRLSLDFDNSFKIRIRSDSSID